MSRGFVQSFIVKLLITIVAVVFVIILGMRLLSNFINDPDDSAAVRSAQILAQRIDVMERTGESVSDTVVSFSKEYVLIAFPKDVDKIDYRYVSEKTGVVLERPRSCGDSCICAYNRAPLDALGPGSTVPLKCRDVEDSSVAGGIITYGLTRVVRIERDASGSVKLKPYDLAARVSGDGRHCLADDVLSKNCPDW
jgi:hypothetical protein